MGSAIIERISSDLQLPEPPVAAAVELLDRKLTPPFILHYRKEAIAGLDRSQLYAVRQLWRRYKDVEARGASLIRWLQKQGKLTDELRGRVEQCRTRLELEEIQRPFRSQGKTRASEAVDKGLQPLADHFWEQEPDAWSIQEHIGVHVDPEKQVESPEQALQGAADIVAQRIADMPEIRAGLREMLWKEGLLVSRVAPAKAGKKTKYAMYYDRREPVGTIPSHRVLAIRRGTREGILVMSIECDHGKALELILEAVCRDRESLFAPFLEAAAKESYYRILKPMIESEVRARVKERADREAVRVFQENLANLLLAPPAGAITVMGVEPGKQGECALAVIDGSGALLEHATISPLPPKNETDAARAALREILQRNKVAAIAVGSGTASREAEAFFRQFLADDKLDSLILAAVNEAGVAVYAGSRSAREEFPDLEPAARAAVSIARRLQDPLSEMVKIDPRLIGVGQYQHDVDQRELQRSLRETVQQCVCEVGVDLNRADRYLLRSVAGLNDKLALKIIEHREKNGSIASRASLLTDLGLDEFTFQQAAGFLRIRSGENPLDATAVHPESYPLVQQMAANLQVETADLIGNQELISSLKLEEYANETIGMPTLLDIREELLKPGRDPRRTFKVAKYRSDVRDISDLQVGMTLEGTVTNVTNFGAFVDLGIRQDGLVHLSQMSNRFIRDPREAVKVGDVVQVKVISVEAETKRIGLSMKALLPAPPRRRKKPQPRREKVKAGPANPDQPVGAANPAGASGRKEGRPPRKSAPKAGARRRPHRKPPARVAEAEARADAHKAERKKEPEEEKPAGPEPTLQEKIAILQSKFKGAR